MSNNPNGNRKNLGWQTQVLRFAHAYGWWRVFAIPVLAVITIWVLVDILKPDESPDPAIVNGAYSQPNQAAEKPSQQQPAPKQDPQESTKKSAATGMELPPGGPYSQRGEGTFREVGYPGLNVGLGTETVFRFSVEVENGLEPANYGGDDAFAAVIDNTLSDPRSWINDSRYEFIHVSSADNPDTKIRLVSADTAAEICGNSLRTETSCHTTAPGESVTIINEARWIRGAFTFKDDVENYRRYVINHELGHAIGYASHQPCSQQEALAPVMMQQTLSLNNSALYRKSPGEVYPDDNFTCKPNPWPYPEPSNMDLYNPGVG